MSELFADSYYFMALLIPRDAGHRRATEYVVRPRRLVTTWFVLIEVANALHRPGQRELVIELVESLQNDANVDLIPVSESLLIAGYERYCNRLDKHWSLTDCTSFIVMDQMGIRDALTADHHFEQAGFVALLK